MNFRQTHTIRTEIEEGDSENAVKFVVLEKNDSIPTEVMCISFNGGQMTVAVKPGVTMDDAARAFLSALQRVRAN